jgi:hypothetical protein
MKLARACPGARTVAAALLACALGAGSCQRSPAPTAAQDRALPEAQAPAAPEPKRQAGGVALSVAEEARVAPIASAAGTPAAAPRKLIRNGRLSVEVPDYERAAYAIARIAADHGGYVAASQASRGDAGRQRGTLTLRVSADRFDSAMAAVKSLGRLASEGVGVDDITKAYADLETRLRVKRETEARVREILRTRAGKLSEVLEAERELGRLTEEIEQLEGERRFYDQQVALATIHVELFEPLAVVRPGLLSPIGDALRESLSVLSQSVAALIYVAVASLPWLFALALVWRGLRWAWRRRTRTPPAPPGTTA